MGELEGITDSSNIYIHSGERLVLQYANRGGGISLLCGTEMSLNTYARIASIHNIQTNSTLPHLIQSTSEYHLPSLITFVLSLKGYSPEGKLECPSLLQTVP